MAGKILFDRFGEPYQSNQNINAKLDTLIEIVGDMKDDIAELKTDVADLKIDVAELKTDVANLKKDVERLDKKIDKVEESNKADIAEVKAEISSARWQIIAIFGGQIVGIIAMVAAVISALK